MFVALAGIALIVAVLPGAVSAHETRTVADKYKFVVGFLTEPPIADQSNGIDLTVTDASSNQPVLGLEKTLKAQILVGSDSQDVILTPRFNLPGKYAAYVIPTKSGTWKFRFSGKVNDDSIDETFTSGPGRFNDVASPRSLEFPAKAPSLVEMAAQVSAAQTLASVAIVVGAAGTAVGAIGLVVAGIAISRLRRDRLARPTTSMEPKPL